MLISRQRFLEDLDPNDVQFNLAEMIIAVETRKNLSRKKYDYTFISFVTDDDNINDFLDIIHYNIQRFANHTRFEVIHMHNMHWTTMDIEINNGNIQIFLFDPASASVIPEFISTLVTYPNTTITYSSGSIQKSDSDCGTFAYDAAFQLSKISDLHQKLHQCRKYASEAFKEKLAYLPLSELSGEFGRLLRNAQSFTTINTLKKYSPDLVGNSTLLLNDYLQQKNRMEQTLEPPYKWINVSISVKQYALKLKMKNYVEKLLDNEFKKLLENAANFIDLSVHLTLPETSKPAVYLPNNKFKKEFIAYTELERAAYFHGITFAEMKQKIDACKIDTETLYEVIGIFDDKFKIMSLPFLQVCQLNIELTKSLQSDPISLSGIDNKIIKLIGSDHSFQTAAKLLAQLAKIPLHEFNNLGDTDEIKQLLKLSNILLCKKLCDTYKIPFRRILGLSYEKREIIFMHEDRINNLLKRSAWEEVFNLSEQDLFDRLNDPFLSLKPSKPTR